MRLGLNFVTLCTVLPLCAFGREPLPAANCARCHPAETMAHSKSRMGSAMVPALASAFARDVESLALKEPAGGYQFAYRKRDSDLEVTAFRGTDHANGSIAWVLGSGAQGQTPIVQSGDKFFESRVSFFPGLHQYGITVGQAADASPNAMAALGRPKTPAELSQCLGCHGVVLDSNFTAILPGVQCQQCHPGATQHAEGQGTPVNPGKLPAARQVQLCGTCHRNAPPVDDTQLENIRFQPLRLTNSQCFKSDKLACTTCHPAHQDARRAAPAFYNEKCVGCHQGSSRFHTDARAQGNCIGCHMPQVQLHPALKFTDHFIRVVQSSDYPPGSVVRREGG